MGIIFSKELLMSESKVTLTVTTNPASATCTLTYDGNSYTTKTASVKKGTIISYSVYHSTYGTKTGTITMDSDKTLTFTGTYSTTSTDVSWTRPNLSGFGTMGGSSFACEAKSANAVINSSVSGYEGWKAFDGISNSSSNYWDARGANMQSAFPAYITWYNPTAIKVTQVTITQQRGDISPKTGTIQASDNNSNWTTLTSWTNSNVTTGASWNINLSSNTNFYNYYKLNITASNTSGGTTTQIREITMTAYTEQTSYTYYWDVTTS